MRPIARICVLALLTAAAAQAAAFTFQPMFSRLDPSGPGSIQTFEVSNEGDESLAVRFSVLSRSAGPAGEERNEDASGLFVIYPARLVVEPRSTAALKLQWKGPAGISAERAFRLVAESVPLDSGTQVSSGIKVMFRYVASVYIGKEGFTPDLVASVRGATGKAGEKGFSVEILNRGKRHVVAESAVLTIKGVKGAASGGLAMGSDQLGALAGANYLPGNPLRLFIPRADAVPGKSYAARLDYEAEY